MLEKSIQRISGATLKSLLSFAVITVCFLLTPTQAYAQCTNPGGDPGDIIYNDDEAVFQGCVSTGWTAFRTPGYQAQAVEMTPSNEVTVTTNTMSWTPTGTEKQVTGSLWFKRDQLTDDNQQLIFGHSSTIRIRLFRNDDASYPNSLEIHFDDDDITGPVPVGIVTTQQFGLGQWHHLLFSIDVATGSRHVFIDGLEVTNFVQNFSNDRAFSIPFSGGQFISIGSNAGFEHFQGSMADVWLDFDTYLDLSDIANVRKFIDANGMPVDLGSNGQNVTGNAPEFFFSGDDASWHTNKGNAGGFTLTGTLGDDGYVGGGTRTSGGTGSGLPSSDNLIGHWTFDETSGTEIVDVIGGNNAAMQGTLNAADDNAAGRIDGAIEFVEADSHSARAADRANYDSGSFSVSAWVYKPSAVGAGNELIVTKRHTASPWQVWRLFQNSSNRFVFTVFDATETDINLFSAPITWPAWVHVVGVYDDENDEARLYVDGVQSDVETVTSLYNSNGQLRFGEEDSSEYLDGRLDDVRIYNKALTAAEVTALYNGFPCRNPDGESGDIIYNHDHGVFQGCSGNGWEALHEHVYIPNAVRFDGSSTVLRSEGILSDVTDGTKVTMSMWFKSESGSPENRMIFHGDGDTDGTLFVQPHVPGSGDPAIGDMFVILRDSTSDAQALNVRIRDAGFEDGEWHHLLFSADVTDPGKRHVIIDGVVLSEGSGVNQASFLHYVTTAILEFTPDDANGINIGAAGTGNYWNGHLMDIWVDFNNYIDLSVEANRRKFIDADGKPVFLGPNGELPTGTKPDIFLSGDTDTWHTNKGSGGGFTDSVTMTEGSTIIVGGRIPTDGLVGHWTLDETTGAAILDSSGFGNTGVWTDGANDSVAEETLAGQVDAAIDFDGSDDVVRVDHNGEIDDLDEITVSAWIYADNVGEGGLGRIIDKAPANNDFIFYLDDTGGAAKLAFQGRRWDGAEGNWSSSDDVLAYGQWSHVAVTYSYSATGNDPVFYVNGVSAGFFEGTAPTGSVASTPGELYIGNSDDGSRSFNGRIDDVRIYNRTLDAAEIFRIYSLSQPTCANAEGRPGDIIYNDTEDTFQGCTPAGWKAMGSIGP